MKKKLDFKDIMSLATFVLALLTLILRVLGLG